MEPFEFTSNGGGGEALPRRVKRRTATFYEVIKFDGLLKSPSTGRDQVWECDHGDRKGKGTR